MAWQALLEANIDSDEFEIGAEPIAIAIQHFLTENMDDDCVGFKGTIEWWRAAVEASDLAAILQDDVEPGTRPARGRD